MATKKGLVESLVMRLTPTVFSPPDDDAPASSPPRLQAAVALTARHAAATATARRVIEWEEVRIMPVPFRELLTTLSGPCLVR
ncbi:hypothetical protein GCM10025868_20990 [Angustibacter aerolatus]|uniref:Uncharacterized protein n=1 Tax=Angustibacter aerolatus TaxID=1162965 RepID=A0ABQ6JGD4_9ACTN|nr:hypothetical protein GCM10025868_20990 [Angustibacter aerolatus]